MQEKNEVAAAVRDRLAIAVAGGAALDRWTTHSLQAADAMRA